MLAQNTVVWSRYRHTCFNSYASHEKYERFFSYKYDDIPQSIIVIRRVYCFRIPSFSDYRENLRDSLRLAHIVSFVFLRIWFPPPPITVVGIV